jgi:hypothetical protein
MSKFFIFSLLALIGTTTMVESAMAQNRLDRDGLGGRRDDYRAGYKDGEDCTKLAMEAASIVCQEQRGSRSQCSFATSYAAESPDSFLYEVASDRNADIYSPGARAFARQALSCREDRQSGFDSDIERESNEWHQREEEEAARRRRQQQG